VKLPLFTSLRGYDSSWLRGDLVAGLTVWAVLVPEALAYASIAGVSPVVGLYAAPAALLLYAAFGSSRHLVVGPMSATAALSAAAVADVATPGSAGFVAHTAALAITTGLIAVLAGVLRLGFLASFISEPVLKGFIIGLALTIVAGQLPDLFGVEGGGGDFFEKLGHLLAQLGQTSLTTLAVGLASLALVLGLRRLAPVVPGSLVTVLAGIAAVGLFNLDAHGVGIVGQIDSGLPALGTPAVAAADYLNLAPAAAGVMLVGFAEGLGAARSYAAAHHYEVDANQELLGLGTANLGAGLASGMVVNGSLSKTAVNGAAGARSQVSGLVVAALTVLTLLFLTGLFEQLPQATLAAVVIAAVIELVDLPALVALYRIATRQLRGIYGIAARPDFLAAVAALAGVLVFDTLPGLFLGVIVSLLLLLYRASRPHVAVLGQVPGMPGQYGDIQRHPENELAPGIALLRVEGGLFFANADTVRAAVLAHAAEPGTRAVVLDAETAPYIDVSAARMLVGLTADLRRSGVELVIARDVGQVRDVLRRAEVPTPCPGPTRACRTRWRPWAAAGHLATRNHPAKVRPAHPSPRILVPPAARQQRRNDGEAVPGPHQPRGRGHGPRLARAGAGARLAAPLPAGLAAWGRRRRPHHLGAGGAPGDRVRPDRPAAAPGRVVRRLRRPGRLRPVRHVPAAGGQPDLLHRGHLGRDRGPGRPGRRRPLRRPLGRPGHAGRGGADRARGPADGVRVALHLRRGPGRLHVRPGA
jgi:sulfate permease, SulP family